MKTEKTEKIINKWKSLKNYPGYEINSLGRVRSIDRISIRGYSIKGKLLNLSIDGAGYYHVRMYVNGKIKSRQVHKLIARVYHGHIDGDGMIAEHIDNNRLNNAKENIQLTTQRINASKDRHRNPNKSSKYVGVCWNKAAKKWQANIWNGSKRIYLGLFIVEWDARVAYLTKLKTLEYAKN